MRATVERGAWLLTVIVLLALATGCTRKTTLMQRDTTGPVAAAGGDSTTQLLHAAEQAWDAQSDDAGAATLTLRAVREDLRGRPPHDWVARAGELLDSLGVGVETAGGPCGMMVNVFVRADPGRGSWPALYWCDGALVRSQEVEGRNMRLLGMVSAGGSDSLTHGAPLRAAALFGRSRLGRQEPLLFAWSRRPRDTKWKIVQTLGPDSLGGFGTGAFEAPSDSATDLVTRTFHTPRGWDECNTCPHVLKEHRFRWQADGFHRVADRDVPSTYATFVSFVDAMQSDLARAQTLVSDPSLIQLATQYQFDHSRGTWRIAPATEDAGSELRIFRGGQEAYRVTFEPRGDDWVINNIQTVARSVE